MILKRYFLALFILIFSGLNHSAFSQCPLVTPSFTTSQTLICGTGATTITFNQTSTGPNANFGSTDYDWYRNGVFFDHTTGNNDPNNSNISAAGTYTYMMISEDNSGCIDTAIVVVTIVPTPNANFTFNPNNACAGTIVAFTNTSTGFSAGNTTYNWNFGDAGTSTATSPTHVYAAGGTYTVTLTMTNGAGCTDVQTSTVTVTPSPTAGFIGDDGDGDMTYCLLPGDPTTSETVTFFNTSTGAVSYLWNFGDGNTSTATDPTHTYTTFGTYTVTLTATGANGCTNVSTQTVIFEKFVGASLSLDITEYSGCAPHTLTTLVNGSVNANTYTWNFGDGSPPVVTTSPIPPAHTYVTGGTYTISLTAANSCNTATATISPIIIVAGPNANFNLSTTLGCAPQNVTFANASTGAQPANNYQWNMGNGNTYTNVINPPAQNYLTQGSYTVTLIAGSACGFDTIQRVIVIDSIPEIDLVVNPLEGCTPLTVTSVNNSTGNSLSYQWFIDGVFTYTSQQIPNQVFTAPVGNNPVTHTIQLTVSNHCGTKTDIESIIVHPAVNAIFTMNTDTVCVGGSVTFNQTSTGDQLVYGWDFGEGTTSTLPGPHTITYNTPGTYPVELTVTGFCGPSTVIHNVVVLPFPIADFTPNVTIGCMPLAVGFTNNSTVGATSYNWNFGAGAAPATSTLYNPLPVTYNTGGTSTITLTVNDRGCVSTHTENISINPLPVPTFTVTPNNGCTPLNVTFNNTSAVTLGDTYDWDFGNGNTSTQQNPAGQIYTAPGLVDVVYTVELIITTAAGCVDSISQTITVHPLPIADFTALPDTVCAGTPVAYLNNSTLGNTWDWNFGDAGTSAVMSPSHTYVAQGTYSTQLIAISAFGCRDTITHNVVVDSIPAANFNFTIECLSDSTHFTDLSTGGITNWNWNFGDASSSTLSDPAHLYATNGNFSVTLTVTNPAGCTNSNNQLVTVNAVPVAAFTTTSTCLNSPSTFTDNTSGVPIAWEWNFGDGSPVSNLQNPTHTYAATGTYTVQLISFGGAGCSDTITGNITVTPIPTADFTFTNVCTNDTTFFIDASLGTPDTWSWNFGDGSPANTNQNPFHVYTASGTYNVTLTAGYAASGCTNAITFPVTAFPRTNPLFTANTPCLNAPTNFVDQTTNVPTLWTWNFGDGSPLDNTQNPSHTYSTAGTFNIQLVTENAFGCIDTLNSAIDVFPLPVADYTFTIACELHTTTFTDASTSAAQYQWNFDDGSPNDLNPNPTHIFTNSGTYNVELVVTNIFGCTDTSIQAVTVNPNPTAAFTSTVACHTYPNFFTDNSVGAIQWNWEFGDASANDINQNTSHIYPNPGTYNTELMVTNVFGCTDSITQTTTVLLQPQSGFTNSTVCAGASVQFTDTTTGAPTQWTWDFGDGSPVNNSQNPVHAFAIGGIYNITLITGNIAGCLDTTVIPVNVFTVPFPNFTNDTVCLFGINHFTDLSTDPSALTNWFWDFGDGNNSFAQNPNYIYQAAGAYNVTLLVTNINGCDSSITLPVIVNAVPVAAFTSDTACVGSPTTFTDLSTGNPTSWLWNFGDGNTSNVGPTVTHTYAGPGSYIVTLFVSGGPGNCFDQTFATAFVSNTVQAGFILQDSACEKSIISFVDTTTIIGGTITGWNWDFGDGNFSTLQNPTHQYLANGTYTVTLSVNSSGGCTSNASHTIIISETPIANFSANSPCENMATQFLDLTNTNGSTIDTWDWNFGDLNTDVVQNPAHVYANSGIFNTTLIVTTTEGCGDTITLPVDVHPAPLADFSSTIECWGDPVPFTDLSTITGGDIITNWDWNFGDGNTSIQQNPQNIFTVFNDTFAVQLVVTTNFGCVDTIVQDAYTLPIVVFDYGPDNANACAPVTVQFTDNSTISQGTITGWIWGFDDGTNSFQQNPTHHYANDGTYYVSLTVTTSTGCTYEDTLQFPLTVYPQPIPGFSVDPNVTTILEPDIDIMDESIGAMLWEYDFGDLTHGNDPSSTHEYFEPGTYEIMQIVTNNFGCSDTAYQTVTIEEVATVYAPNAFTPAIDGKSDGLNDIFYVLGTGIENYKLYIFDRWGELLFEADDMNIGWDGTYKGIAVKPDVYVWRVVCDFITGEQGDYYGHVTVVK
jgi:gliding motility-associated-like protein